MSENDLTGLTATDIHELYRDHRPRDEGVQCSLLAPGGLMFVGYVRDVDGGHPERPEATGRTFALLSLDSGGWLASHRDYLGCSPYNRRVHTTEDIDALIEWARTSD